MHTDVTEVMAGFAAWTTDLLNGTPPVAALVGVSASYAAMAGYPIISVPAGNAFGMPVGISFIGTAFSEPTLIQLAYAFEQVTKARTVPKFLQSLHLGKRNSAAESAALDAHTQEVLNHANTR
jgi:amidase